MPHDHDTIVRARSFNGVADAYDAHRPGYPDELLDDVMGFAGDHVADGVLDVGAGTGKATLPLAQRGVRVTALEPAENMARVLRDRAARDGLADRVTVRVGVFEDLGPADGPFGLVVAAQSFHWTDPDTRWARLVGLLVPGGAAAMFWNGWSLDPAAHDIEAVRRVYRLHGAELVPDLGPAERSDWPADEITSAAGLVEAAERSYMWDWSLSTSEYLELLATTSQYAVLVASHRHDLFRALSQAVGHRVQLRCRAQLNMVRKAISRTDESSRQTPARPSWTGVC